MVVFRDQGFRFYFFSNEEAHANPFLDADRAGAEAKLWLYPVVQIATSSGFDSRQQGALVKLVENHRELIVKMWLGYLG